MLGRPIRDVMQSGAECAYCEDCKYKVFRKEMILVHVLCHSRVTWQP